MEGKKRSTISSRATSLPAERNQSRRGRDQRDEEEGAPLGGGANQEFEKFLQVAYPQDKLRLIFSLIMVKEQVKSQILATRYE